MFFFFLLENSEGSFISVFIFIAARVKFTDWASISSFRQEAGEKAFVGNDFPTSLKWLPICERTTY
jgi:hypothetical protein